MVDEDRLDLVAQAFALVIDAKSPWTFQHSNGVADFSVALARILCTADICDALSASRPYRDGMPPDRVLAIMRREVGDGIDPDCFAALERILETARDRTPEQNTPAARSVPALAEDYAQAA